MQPAILSEFNAQDISNTCWGLATMGMYNWQVMNMLANHALQFSNGTMATFSAQVLCRGDPAPCSSSNPNGGGVRGLLARKVHTKLRAWVSPLETTAPTGFSLTHKRKHWTLLVVHGYPRAFVEPIPPPPATWTDDRMRQA